MRVPVNYCANLEMFDWLKSKFGSGTTQLTAAATRLNKAQTAYGNTNSRKVARNAAEQLEASATATKATVELAKKNLQSITDRCSSEQDIAEKQLDQARAEHNKVKDTTFQKIGRLVTVGRAGWGSRTAAVNAAQKRQANNITKRREALRAIAQKQKDAIEKEEAARKVKAELISKALDVAHDSVTEAKGTLVPLLPKNGKNNNNGPNEHAANRGYTPLKLANNTVKNNIAKNNARGNNNNNVPTVNFAALARGNRRGSNPAPLSGGRRGTRGRKTRGRR